MLPKHLRSKYITLFPRLFAYLLLIVLIINGCKEKSADKTITRAFYYWKSSVNVSTYESNKLDSLQVSTLYCKFFDVDWNAETRQPIPVAKLMNAGSPGLKKYLLIPTVFITNECIQNIDTSQTSLLAEKIWLLIQETISINKIDPPHEVQIDCDWSASTKDKYFSILEHIRSLSGHTILSVTIRLHQVKFVTRVGVPPADKGLLMCYNMGNLKNPATNNSIIETTELKKYISGVQSYPLHLDIALPLFDWKVLFRDNIYAGLIGQLADTMLTPAFSIRSGNMITLLQDTLLQGYQLKKGDRLRVEKSAITEILAAAKEINKRLENNDTRVSLYHLDSLILSKYTTHELESIYSSFR